MATKWSNYFGNVLRWAYTLHADCVSEGQRVIMRCMGNENTYTITTAGYN